MLRHYGRLGIITATIAICFIIYSLKSLQTSPSQFGITPESQLQGEELLGSKLGAALGSKQDETTQGDVQVAPESAPQREPEQPEPALIRPEDPTIETESQPATKSDDAGEEQEQSPIPSNDSEKSDEEAPAETSESEEEEPTPTPITKLIVVGQLSSENTDWIREEMTEWQNAIYYVDLNASTPSPSGLRTRMNKAKEAMPYLTYLVENYPDFPDVMAFIHAHRRGMPEAWHNDAPNNDAVHMLNALRIPTVLERGYVNLRCNNEVGCPDEIQPWRDPPDEEKHAEHAFPYIYANFFNASVAEMKEQIPVVATQCCAQFAVSREQVLKKPKSEYVRYLTFLEETHYDDDVAGRVLEYMWHIIFGRDAVHCENVFECWCAVYGRCMAGGRLRGGGGGQHF